VLQCVAVCCSVLQCAVVCCSVLQCVAVWFGVLQHVAVFCSMLQCVAVCCSEWRQIKCLWLGSATYCNTLQHTATHCNTLQHTASRCNIVQRTATHRNTLQHPTTYCNCTTLWIIVAVKLSLQCVAVCCRESDHCYRVMHREGFLLQCVKVCCRERDYCCTVFSVLRCVAEREIIVAVCCSVFQCVSVCCSVLQCVAVCCIERWEIRAAPVWVEEYSCHKYEWGISHPCIRHVTHINESYE